MSNSNECVGLFGRLFGHNFQPRYDEVLSDAAAETLDRLEEIESTELQYVIRAFSESIFIHDVCTRCGANVPRMVDTVLSAKSATPNFEFECRL